MLQSIQATAGNYKNFFKNVQSTTEVNGDATNIIFSKELNDKKSISGSVAITNNQDGSVTINTSKTLPNDKIIDNSKTFSEKQVANYLNKGLGSKLNIIA